MMDATTDHDRDDVPFDFGGGDKDGDRSGPDVPDAVEKAVFADLPDPTDSPVDARFKGQILAAARATTGACHVCGDDLYHVGRPGGPYVGSYKPDSTRTDATVAASEGERNGLWAARGVDRHPEPHLCGECLHEVRTGGGVVRARTGGGLRLSVRAYGGICADVPEGDAHDIRRPDSHPMYVALMRFIRGGDSIPFDSAGRDHFVRREPEDGEATHAEDLVEDTRTITGESYVPVLLPADHRGHEEAVGDFIEAVFADDGQGHPEGKRDPESVALPTPTLADAGVLYAPAGDTSFVRQRFAEWLADHR